jgi:hypothetical protein
MVGTWVPNHIYTAIVGSRAALAARSTESPSSLTSGSMRCGNITPVVLSLPFNGQWSYFRPVWIGLVVS